MLLLSACSVGFAEPPLPAAPPAEVSLLSGGKHYGIVARFTADSIVLHGDSKTGGREVAVPFDQVMRVDFQPSKESKNAMQVLLADRSRFAAVDAVVANGRAVLDLEHRKIELAVDNLSSILFGGSSIDRAVWTATSLQQQRLSQPGGATNAAIPVDRVVAYRDARRLTLDGTIAAISKDKVMLAMDGDEIPINRSRVRSVSFARRLPSAEPTAFVTSTAGDLWSAAELRWNNGIELRTPSKIEVRVPLDRLASIDFSPSKVVYFSDMTPVLMQHTPTFDLPWSLATDRNVLGEEIQIAGRRFKKGLVVHSRTVVEYSLGGAYKWLQTQVGIESAGGPFGDADVRMSADGKEIWKGTVKAGSHAIPLSLPISGVDRFRLEVDFGRNLDLGDHVGFGDFRVVK